MSDAIYTLANDKTLDWLFGLVGSLQNAGCELSINVIPFDKQTTKLRKSINGWHGVQLWEPPELEQLDEIGFKMCATEHYPRNVFRKLATFWCPHDTFIYLDADIVVGGNPAHWIARYKQARAEVDIVAMDDAWWWVFRSGRLSAQFVRDKRAAVNTGFWIGRQGLISFKDVVCAADSAQCYKTEFMLEYGEVSFWNYLMWNSKVVVRTFPVLGSEFVNWSWATHSVAPGDGLGFVEWKPGSSKNSTSALIIPFLHWAGLKAGPEMVNWHLYLKAALSAANWSGRLALLYRFCRRNPRVFLYKVLKSILIKITLASRTLTRGSRWRDGPFNKELRKE